MRGLVRWQVQTCCRSTTSRSSTTASSLVLKGVSVEVGEGAITTLLGPMAQARRRRSRPYPACCAASAARSQGNRAARRPSHRRHAHHDVTRLGLVQVFEGRRVFENLTTEENLVAGGTSG